MAISKEPIAPPLVRGGELGALAAATVRSPASWIFAVVWLACALYLAAIGLVAFIFIALAILAAISLLVWLTLLLTRGAPTPAWMRGPSPAEVRRDGRAWIQLAFLLATCLLVTQWILSWNRLAPMLPLWNPLLGWLATIQNALHIPSNWLMVPLLYCALPAAVLLLLGARPRELGLGRGFHVWRVAALWSALQAAYLIIALATGQRTPLAILSRALGTTLNSGPFEEFLFRGALMTRVARLFGTGWGIVISSIFFGVLHTSTETLSDGRGNVLAGLALGILLQGAGSIGYAVMQHRTGNLLASSVSHILTNVAGG